ncbi:MAG: InlB B-repeat-containing protein [Bacteroidales bacterium]|nr:InlB B-repeat-containing protein [Bacteroidales bacterium]
MIISSDFIISGGSPKIHNSASDNNLFLKTGDQDEILPTVSFTGEPLSTDAIIHINSESIIDQVFTVGIPDLSAAYSYVNSFVSDKPDRAVVVDHPTHQLAFASASYVASISNSETTVYYQTLEAAVTDWVDGTILHLLKDVETASTITVPAGDHTLDLNGHALKKTGSSGSVLFVGTGANLELVDNHSDGPVHYYTPNKSGLATLSETETEYSFTGGYITGGIGSTGNYGGRKVGGGVNVDGGTFTMNGGTIFGNGKHEQWYTGGAVQVTGDGESKGVFTMNGGALIGNAAQFGGAIEVISYKPYGHGPAECTINGGEIKHNTVPNENSAYSAIRLCINEYAADLNINGGIITENFGPGGAIGGGNFSISGSPVVRGNFNGDKECNLNLKYGIINVTGALGEDAIVGVTMETPGVFTSSENTALNDLSKFFSDDETYVVKKNDDGQLELYIPPVASVTVDGTTTVYTNFAAALEAWVDGSTLQLLSDIETVNTIVAPSGTLTLDLNGHGILMTGGKTVLQVGNSDDPTTNLTMIDSDPNRVHYVTLENYVAKSVADDGTESITDGTGTVKITGGYIAGGQTGLYCVGNRSGETYQAGAGIYVGRATFTMKAGTIIGNKTTGSGGGLHVGGIDSHAIMDGGRICYNCSNSGGAVNIGINGWISHQPGVGKFTMNGGLIDSNYALAQQAGYGGAFRINNGKLHLNGGSIINNKTAGTAVAGILYDHKGGCEGNINYIYVSGNAVLKDNYNANGICNIYLTDGAYITVEGEMGEDASIGVSMQTPGVFTNSTNTDYNDITKFFNDDELYIVRKNDDGQLKLALAPVATIIASDGTTTEYETLEEALDAWVDGSTLKLIRDVKPTSTITVPSGTLTLDLNGHGILRTGEGSVISVPTDATLNIEDNDNSVHYITLEDYYAVSVSKVGTEVTPVEGTGVVKVIGGYIAGGYYPGSGATPAGAGLHVEGTVNMSGGTIIGNRTENYSGGGIATSYNGSVSLSGDAQVIYNKALGWGGAIYNLGSLSVSDEVAIMHNYGFSAIHQYTSMSISGSPQIYDNVATYTGRGIRVEQKLSIVGPLTGAKISVCLNNIGDQTQSREGQLTLTSEYIDANTAAQFVCENDGESGFTIVRKGQELWVTTGYSVNYLANGGEGTTVDENNPYEKNSTATILENAFTTTEGIQFANWNTKEDGSGDTYKPGDSYKVIGNLTLYAQWKRTTYTFTVTANNSEGGTVEVYGDDIIKNEDGTYTVEPGTEIIIKATAAEGYILSSWSNGAEVNEDGTIKVVVTGAVNIVANFGRPFAMATNHKAEAADSEVQNGFEIYTYGYCNGSSYRLKYYLSVGEPDQYKVEFDDNRFTDVDWTYLTTIGNEGTIDLNIPADLTTGDYSMKVFFRNSEFLAFPSDPIIVSFHVNLPETYTVPLYENVIAVVNTCECLTDIQWYHRDNSNAAWQAISGATGYYYRQVGGLTGEYFISTKMNGVSTYTCPQTDVKTLYGAPKKVATVRVSPNPIANDATVSIEDSENFEHSLRIVNIMGKVIEVRTFNGNSTSINLSAYPTGTYLISVDGIGVKVIRK